MKSAIFAVLAAVMFMSVGFTHADAATWPRNQSKAPGGGLYTGPGGGMSIGPGGGLSPAPGGGPDQGPFEKVGTDKCLHPALPPVMPCADAPGA